MGLQKPFVFVLMPFNNGFDDIYQLGIKQACINVGAYCERVDEQQFDGNILDRIYNQIQKADIVISDMSGKNPNVFYETGYAHALGKRVIHLTQKASDIPFDMQHYPHIIYENRIVSLKQELEKKLQWCIDNPNDSVLPNSIPLDIYVNLIKLSEDNTADVVCTLNGDYETITLNCLLKNQTSKTIETRNVNVSILIDHLCEVSDASSFKSFSLPGQKVVVKRKNGLPDYFLPEEWDSFSVHLNIEALFKYLRSILPPQTRQSVSLRELLGSNSYLYVLSIQNEFVNKKFEFAVHVNLPYQS